MLQVRAISKLRDEKGMLVGYTIQDTTTGQKMNVYKDNLKQAVISKQCEVVNLTLTSDGRLIGKAAPAPVHKKKQIPGTGIVLIEVYTNGRSLVAGFIDKTTFDKMVNEDGKDYKGLPAHQSFDVGHELMENIKNNYYDNVRMIDGKPDMSKVKRKSFSKIKSKMINLLKNNGAESTLKVEKGESKYEYHVLVENYDRICDEDPLVQALYALIVDALVTAKIKTLYINEGEVVVSCMTGINDVRKALKEIKF